MDAVCGACALGLSGRGQGLALREFGREKRLYENGPRVCDDGVVDRLIVLHE